MKLFIKTETGEQVEVPGVSSIPLESLTKEKEMTMFFMSATYKQSVDGANYGLPGKMLTLNLTCYGVDIEDK